MNTNEINEDYPQSFNMEEFKKLNSFSKRIKYCEENLERINSGSSRIVYKIDDEKVLKLAKNAKGLAQNDVEIRNSQDYYISSLLADIFEYDENDLWLEMEYCKKLTFGRFKEITGVSFKDFKYILNYANQESSNRRSYIRYSKPDIYDDLEDYEFVYSMVDYIQNYDVLIGDLLRISSYGEDKHNNVVIIDYGLDNDVYKTHYSG